MNNTINTFMILLADSGSTKTDWAVIKDSKQTFLFQTEGLNPYLQDYEDIFSILQKYVLPNITMMKIDSVYFYGAGCTPEKSVIIETAIRKLFKYDIKISVKSDLLGAAIALLGNNSGVACILGTGSNSCVYDGKSIIDHISPLGYILGDEGSGSYIGKRFLADCMKREVPKLIYTNFLSEYNLTEEKIIESVYKGRFPNRFLASIVPFISKNKENKYIHNLLTDCFTEFFKRNILHYENINDVNIVGSIAFYFQKEIKETASLYNIKINRIIKTPIEGLINYYSREL